MEFDMELNGNKVVDWEMDLYGATEDELNPYNLLFTGGEFANGCSLTGVQLHKLSKKYPNVIYQIIKEDLSDDNPLHKEFANYVPVAETPEPAMDPEQLNRLRNIAKRAYSYFSPSCQETIYLQPYDWYASANPGENLKFRGWGADTESDYEVYYNEVNVDEDYFQELKKIDFTSV